MGFLIAAVAVLVLGLACVVVEGQALGSEGARWCTYNAAGANSCRSLRAKEKVVCLTKVHQGQCYEAVCSGEADFTLLTEVNSEWKPQPSCSIVTRKGLSQDLERGGEDVHKFQVLIRDGEPCVGVADPTSLEVCNSRSCLSEAGSAVRVPEKMFLVLKERGELAGWRVMCGAGMCAPVSDYSSSCWPKWQAILVREGFAVDAFLNSATSALRIPAEVARGASARRILQLGADPPSTLGPTTPGPTTPGPTTPGPTTPGTTTPGPTTPGPTTPGPTTPGPTTPSPTTPAPTTPAPTTPAPTTPAPTTPAPTTPSPTTPAPTTPAPTTPAPTTPAPTTPALTTPAPTTPAPTTPTPTTPAPTTPAPTTSAPNSPAPTTPAPTTPSPTTPAPTTSAPTTSAPPTAAPTTFPPIATLAPPTLPPTATPTPVATTTPAPVATTAAPTPVATTAAPPLTGSPSATPSPSTLPPSTTAPLVTSPPVIFTPPPSLPSPTPAPTSAAPVATSAAPITPQPTTSTVTLTPTPITTPSVVTTSPVTSTPSPVTSTPSPVTSTPVNTSPVTTQPPVVVATPAPLSAPPVPTGAPLTSAPVATTSPATSATPPLGTTPPPAAVAVTASPAATAGPTSSSPSPLTVSPFTVSPPAQSPPVPTFTVQPSQSSAAPTVQPTSQATATATAQLPLTPLGTAPVPPSPPLASASSTPTPAPASTTALPGGFSSTGSLGPPTTPLPPLTTPAPTSLPSGTLTLTPAVTTPAAAVSSPSSTPAITVSPAATSPSSTSSSSPSPLTVSPVTVSPPAQSPPVPTPTVQASQSAAPTVQATATAQPPLTPLGTAPVPPSPPLASASSTPTPGPASTTALTGGFSSIGSTATPTTPPSTTPPPLTTPAPSTLPSGSPVLTPSLTTPAATVSLPTPASSTPAMPAPVIVVTGTPILAPGLTPVVTIPEATVAPATLTPATLTSEPTTTPSITSTLASGFSMLLPLTLPPLTLDTGTPTPVVTVSPPVTTPDPVTTPPNTPPLPSTLPPAPTSAAPTINPPPVVTSANTLPPSTFTPRPIVLNPLVIPPPPAVVAPDLPLPTVPLPPPTPTDPVNTTAPEPTTPLPLPPPPPSSRILQCPPCRPGTALRPLDTACDCVLPMIVNLDVSSGLNDFLNLVGTFVKELSEGLKLDPSQVLIIGLSTVPAGATTPVRGRRLLGEGGGGRRGLLQVATAPPPPDSRLQVETWLLPLTGMQLNDTEQDRVIGLLRGGQVTLNQTLFGNYDVSLILRPGELPPPPPPGMTRAPIPGAPPGMGGVQAGGLPAQGFGNIGGGGDDEGISAGIIVVIVLAAVAAAGVCLGGLTGFWIWKSKRGGGREKEKGSPPVKDAKMFNSFAPSELESNLSGFSTVHSPYSGSAREFTYQELEEATNRFSVERILGEGGFGQVFRGKLSDGTEVAVKKLTREGQQGHKEFLAEVEMLSRLHHRHLVQLIGFHSGPKGRLLAYELVENGSVESHLHGPDARNKPLDWESRVKIALGAARGLAYLHEDSNPRVIHRDFKASNILLDNEYTAKVSDFGLAKAAPESDSGHISTRVMGTFGYVAPEYAMTGHLLVKSDVYSYGVVLLELLSGRKPVDMAQPPGQENLVTFARPLLTTRGGLERLIDPALEGQYSFDDCARVAAIASMCVQPEVSHRPFMVEVVQALKLVYQGSETATHVSQTSQDLTNTGLSKEFAVGQGNPDFSNSGPQSSVSGPASYTARPDPAMARKPSWATGRAPQAATASAPFATLGELNPAAPEKLLYGGLLRGSVDTKLGLGPGGSDHSGEMEYEDGVGMVPLRQSWPR